MSVDKIAICYAPDENYAGLTTVSMVSALKNSGREEIEFIIVYSQLSDSTIEKINSVKQIKNCIIRYIKVDNDEFKNFPLANWVTSATWYRAKIAELCPDCDKILYLDCDTMVLDSLTDLFKIDLGDNYLGVSCWEKDRPYLNLKSHKYFNAGVLLINCKKWREDHVFELIKHHIKHWKTEIKYADQDVLNIIADEKKIEFSEEYNYGENYITNERTLSPKIVHFIGTNPNRFDCLHSMKHIWNQYARLTPFYEDFIVQNIYNMNNMFFKLKLDEFKFAVLSKITLGKTRKKYIKKHIRHSKLMKSLKY